MAKGIGIFIGQNEVVAVSAVRAVSGPQIKSFAIEPFFSDKSQGAEVGKEDMKSKPSSPETQAILKALERIKEPKAFATVAVSSTQVATRQFVMPAVPKKDEAGAARFETSRYIPFKISDSILDYHTRSLHKNVLSTTVTAIRRETVATCLQHLHAASVKVLMIEPTYCAVSRVIGALNMTGKSKTHGFVVLQSDGNVNVTLTSHGIVYLSRDFLLSGEAEEDKKRLHEEISASLDYFYKLTDGGSIEHLFLTGFGDLRMWAEHLEHAFNYNIRFDIPNLPSAKDVPQENLNAACIAFGLALRDLRYSALVGNVQLLPKAHRRSGRREMLSFLSFQSLAIFAILLFVRLFFFQTQLAELDQKHQAVKEIFDQKDTTFLSRTVEELQFESEKLKGRANYLKKIFDRPVLFSQVLIAIGGGLPRAIWLDDISLGSARESEKGRGQASPKGLLFSASGLCYSGSVDKETAVVSDWIKYLNMKKAIADHIGEVRVMEIRREKIGKREMTRFRITNE